MEVYNLKDMVKGWFVGGFSPTAYQTNACEVAVKEYKKGDYEPSHFHKVATEITVVVSGKIEMNGKTWSSGDIIIMSPLEVTDFKALSDAVNVVVKVPGVLNDKFLQE